MSIIAKYKFDGSVYADLIPEFNTEFTDYTVTDEVDSENSNHIIRTIESDSLPTVMRFGTDAGATDRQKSLLEVYEIDLSNLTTMVIIFGFCSNLSKIERLICNTTEPKIDSMYYAFAHTKITEIDISDVKISTGSSSPLHSLFYNCANLHTIVGLEIFDHKAFEGAFVNTFSLCTSLTSLDLSNWDTSNATNMQNMFYSCSGLTSLNLSNWDTSSMTNMTNMFAYCISLASLDVSNWDTSNVTDTTNMFINTDNLKYLKCNNVTTLNTLNINLPTKTSSSQGTIICKADITNLDTTTLQSKYWTVVTNPTLIAKYKYDSTIYKNLIPEFNEGYMGFVEDEETDANGVVTRKIEHVELPTLMRFGNKDTATEAVDFSKSLLEILDMNIENLNTCLYMFRYCINLTSVSCNSWNTRNITSLNNMFCQCKSLVYINSFEWDTSNVTDMNGVFFGTNKLTSYLDLNSWNTNKVTKIGYMFSGITTDKLDISNFQLNSILSSSYAFGDTSFTDIGMIYCDQSTINKVASLLPTDHNITIWVESDDILQYDQYDHITYKTQKVQDTVHLNSPLLKGDTIEVIDGKTYHVHRYDKVVLDGSEVWTEYTQYISKNVYKAYSSLLTNKVEKSTYNHGMSDKLPSVNISELLLASIDTEGIAVTGHDASIVIGLNKSVLSTLDLNGFKQWLQANPTTVVYELETPYYELISEEPLELTLLDTIDNTINNNSILPSNMTIANKELSTIAIKPSTTYTLSFDKSNEDSEVTIDICGGEQITTVLNRVELTTPSELGSGIRFISSDGCIISNVRLLEGSLVESAIPRETFEGLQSSFDEGYIIGENLANEKEDYFYEETGSYGNDRVDFKRNLKANTTYTLVRKVSDVKYGIFNGIAFYDITFYTDGTSVQDHNCWYIKDGWYISKYTPTKDVTHFSIVLGNNNIDGDIRPRIIISDYMIFEGDHTHLSEAELMRYIEKGTSHYEEEDYNHVGKYKVEYKVTGKNKFDENYFISHNCEFQTYLPKGDYTFTGTFYTEGGRVGLWFRDESDSDITNPQVLVSNNKSTIKFTNPKSQLVKFIRYGWDSGAVYLSCENLQLEEGTVATEYEPYKEDIKTYYLSSPLLEGDTIEDVNGVATHVKRYEKVVLDGSENWHRVTEHTTNPNLIHAVINTISPEGLPGNFNNNATISDSFSGEWGYLHLELTDLGEGFGLNGNHLRFCVNKSRLISLDGNGFKQFLRNNPVTLIYKLISPIYEPISDESILLDSYTNGHLDLNNENIPIQKTEFRNFTKELAYLQPSTDYIVRFSSDDIGVAKIYLDSSVKEINVVKGINDVIITTPSTIVNNNIIIDGIGFNISDVQVIANAIKDGDIKDFDYFKGLQSSFENGLVADENDENYGKYKVDCKVVGKNKFDGELLQGAWNSDTAFVNSSVYVCTKNRIKVKPSTNYIISGNLTLTGSVVFIGKNGEHLKLRNYNDKVYFTTPNNCEYVKIDWYKASGVTPNDFTNLQIEEGTQATSYEPYKESIHTLYLNSPLLKGDKLVVHDGKLCHYHKMGMVVLDGSENWEIAGGDYFRVYTTLSNLGKGDFENNCWNNFSDNFISAKDTSYLKNSFYIANISGIIPRLYFYFDESKLSTTDVNSFKQWLQVNPTTVVYELAEPYYEPIKPQISQYSFFTVKDGDMEIITTLPIEKINLTYRTDINGVSSIEEQIASIQESTDISSIIDEEVDE